MVPSQANYLLVELTDGRTAKELTKRLLLEYQLFIKDLSAKIRMDGRQFVRIAVRSVEDNRKLLEALREMI